MKTVAVVVLYNPDEELAENINSYINDVDRVYIVDNSNKDNEELFRNKLVRKNAYTYKALLENKGLAIGLNIGCKLAVSEGADYILTMDQDSRFETGALTAMKRYLKTEEYSIVAPNVRSLYFDERENREKIAYIRLEKYELRNPNWVMTSGCLMSAKAYDDVGGFDEKMFIAHLDCDLCYRIAMNGGKILQVGEAVINQHFGNSKPKKLLGRTVHPSYASPVRTYYLFRNQMYMKKKYGKNIDAFLGVRLWKFIVKILVFEPQKIEKMKMALRGVRDASKDRMGEYDIE